MSTGLTGARLKDFLASRVFTDLQSLVFRRVLLILFLSGGGVRHWKCIQIDHDNIQTI